MTRLMKDFEYDDAFDQEDFINNLKQQMREVIKIETIEKQIETNLLVRVFNQNISMFTEPQEDYIFDENDQNYREYLECKK